MFVHRDKSGRIIDVTGSINRAELERLKAEDKWVTPQKKATAQPESAEELSAADLTETERETDENAADAGAAKSGPPDTHALKQEWIDYAVSRGADPAEAEALTKADLIELYGSES